MRTDEVRGVAELARLTLRGGTDRIHELHQGIAGRAFAAVGPGGVPVELAHDAVAGLAYGGVRLALGAGARLAGTVAERRADGRPLDDVPAARDDRARRRPRGSRSSGRPWRRRSRRAGTGSRPSCTG